MVDQRERVERPEDALAQDVEDDGEEEGEGEEDEHTVRRLPPPVLGDQHPRLAEDGAHVLEFLPGLVHGGGGGHEVVDGVGGALDGGGELAGDGGEVVGHLAGLVGGGGAAADLAVERGGVVVRGGGEELLGVGVLQAEDALQVGVLEGRMSCS